MKLKIEIDPSADEEIIIRCKTPDESVVRLEKLITDELGSTHEIMLTSGGREYFVPISSILFFETDGERTAAHTAPDGMLYTSMRLYELEKIAPHSFVRVSKSCIINSASVESITKNIAGPSEVTFFKSAKTAYVSRKYYKELIDRIRETRLTPMRSDT